MASRILVGLLMFASALAYPDFNNRRADYLDSAHYADLVAKRSAAQRSYQSPGHIPHGSSSLEPQLSQEVTNGNSVLGTADAPRLLQYLPDPASSRVKRGHTHPTGGNPDNLGDSIPNTGKTRHYTLTATEQTIAPDGVSKPGLVFNGGYPGPTLEANWGDYIEVHVINNLPNEGLSVHWHGMLQHETPYMDGVPGTQQCPIAPGSSFTYTFRAGMLMLRAHAGLRLTRARSLWNDVLPLALLCAIHGRPLRGLNYSWAQYQRSLRRGSWAGPAERLVPF